MSRHASAAFRRFLCVFTALLVFLSGAFSTAAIAQAQDRYSLTIVKTDGDFDVQGEPVAGASFRINRVPDLMGKSAIELNQIAVANPLVLTSDSPYPMEQDIVAATGSDGAAIFSNLPEGVYLVREIPTRLPNEKKQTISPLLVSVPSDGSNNVILRPKNQPLTVDKQAELEVAVPGEDIVFTVTANVPDVDCFGGIGQFVLVDRFEETLDFQRVSSVKIVGHSPQTLEEGVDWEVDYDPSTRIASLIFTVAGRAKLAAAREDHPETRVEAKLVAVLSETAVPGEVANNIAVLYADGADYNSAKRCLVGFNPVQFDSRRSLVFNYAISRSGAASFEQTARVISPECLALTSAISQQASVLVAKRDEPNPPVRPGQWWPIFGIIGIVTGLILGGGGSSETGSSEQGSSEQGSSSSDGSESSSGKENAQSSGDEKPSMKQKVASALKERPSGLAQTGASVIGIIVLALVLALVGWLILGARRRKEEEEEQ